MKKFLALASVFALVASVAQAASVMWGFGGKIYLNNGSDTVLATDGSAPTVDSASYLALVYLGQNKTSYSLSDITSANVVDSMSYSIVTSGKSSSIGKWDPNTNTYGDNAMASGASFTVLFYNGSAFDYVYSYDAGKGAAMDSNIVTVTSDNMEIANSTIYATGSSTGVGVIAVPEPATGALALAGIALLFKRRKARA